MQEREILKEIIKLKEKKKAVILAHNYQIPPIQDIADFVGDSLELAKISREIEEKLIVFCGVKFMAETTKILSPDKRVLLPDPDAGCPLAESITPEDIDNLRKKYPDAWIVAYVNTTADVKAKVDICCTSANAIEVVKNIPASKIVFVPDYNLGNWIKHNVNNKEIILWKGECYVHKEFKVEEIEQAKKEKKDAKLLAHPECDYDILKYADKVASTSGMLKYARKSNNTDFIIATEEGLIYRLKKENPAKNFFSLGKPKICYQMKKINLEKLYRSLKDEVYEIKLPDEIIEKARKPIEEMVKYA